MLGIGRVHPAIQNTVVQEASILRYVVALFITSLPFVSVLAVLLYGREIDSPIRFTETMEKLTFAANAIVRRCP